MLPCTVTAIMTCFNRREQTLTCLGALFAQQTVQGCTLAVVLVDDGSTDGTADAVRKAFPQVTVLMGNGKLYWCGGMRKAYEHAVQTPPDFILWLNDDVTLATDAISRLLTTAAGHLRSIMIGAMVDPDTNVLSYSGWYRTGGVRWDNLAQRLLSDQVQPCDTFNGNCVLIPRAVYDVVGNLDRHFTHAMGDFDYGFRAGKAGFASLVAPGVAGTCSRNPCIKGNWRDRSLPFHTRARKLFAKKGCPPLEWMVYTRRHAGPLWPLYWVSPYVKFILGIR